MRLETTVIQTLEKYTVKAISLSFEQSTGKTKKGNHYPTKLECKTFKEASIFLRTVADSLEKAQSMNCVIRWSDDTEFHFGLEISSLFSDPAFGDLLPNLIVMDLKMKSGQLQPPDMTDQEYTDYLRQFEANKNQYRFLLKNYF